MTMTTGKLVLLRLFGLTAGRVPLFADWLRRWIVWRTVRSRPDDPYVASSRFFDPRELDTK